MKDFKHDFELRRNILGLASLIRLPEQCIPPIVLEKQGDVLNAVGMLSIKQHAERVKTLEENKDYVKKGGKVDDSDSEDLDDDEADEDSAEEWKKSKKLLEQYGDKLAAGKKLTEQEMQDLALDADFDDDEDDSDFELDCGDDGVHYESRLDDLDELKFVKDVLLELQAQQPARYQALQAAHGQLASQEELGKLNTILQGSEELLRQEKECQKQCEAIDEAMDD